MHELVEQLDDKSRVFLGRWLQPDLSALGSSFMDHTECEGRSSVVARQRLCYTISNVCRRIHTNSGIFRQACRSLLLIRIVSLILTFVSQTPKTVGRAVNPSNWTKEYREQISSRKLSLRRLPVQLASGCSPVAGMTL